MVLQYHDDTITPSVQAVLPLLGITTSKNPAGSFPHCLVALAHFSSLLLNTTLCVANVGSHCWVSVGIDKTSFLIFSYWTVEVIFFSMFSKTQWWWVAVSGRTIHVADTSE